MTVDDEPKAVPFWQRKRLDEMTDGEWDSLCDRCGRCCLTKIAADDAAAFYYTDVGCALQDPATGGCSDYANRKSIIPTCIQLTPANVPTLEWLPPSCGYVRVARGEDLEWWHPLVSGNPESVREAGMSAAGRFSETRFAGALEFHTVDWPLVPVTTDPGGNRNKAMFGGINASTPTPFAADARVDLDLMAEQCFWLLANRCHGLAILDTAGEVASLAIAERIAIMEGLAARGVPVSKLIVGIGPTSPADCSRVATRALELGIRGVMLNVPVPDKVLPRDVLQKTTRALIEAIPARMHLYLSFSVKASSAAACVTALEAFMAAASGRISGIRDASRGCDLGFAALRRFGGFPFEVYTADESVLENFIQRGGAGLIGPAPNLLGPLCVELMNGVKPRHAAPVHRMTHAVGRLLHSGQAVPGVKALLARRTGKTDWARVRLPLRPLRPQDRAALFNALDASGLKLTLPSTAGIGG
jgi:uncharacterized cysteine cluster protein YcgN (CxxCxxCC family)/dihydrodipicolinate synthase/N-acetylneuraminate lyase